MAWGAPTIIFERQILPQQTIHRWKGNLTASRINLKYWKNILIWRLCEEFSQNDSTMAPEWLSEKIAYFQNMNISYIALKHVILRFRICSYFREDSMNTLRNFAKSVFAYISAKFKYFAKQFILTETQDQMSNACNAYRLERVSLATSSI